MSSSVRNRLQWSGALAGALLAGVVLGAAGGWALGRPRQPRREAPAAESDATPAGCPSLHLTPEAVKNAGVTTVTAAPGPLPRTLDTTGTIGLNEDRLARVTSRVTGIVREVAIRWGDQVSTGQVLLTLDSTEAGHAQLEEQSRAHEVGTARNRLTWVQTTSNNVTALLDDLAARKPVEAIERELAQRPVGEDWGKLLTAYSKLRLAEHRLAQIGPLYREGSIGERRYSEARAASQEAEANFRARAGQTRHASQAALLQARQAVEWAEAAWAVSRKQLTLLGLPPDGAPPTSSTAASPDSDGVGLYRITAPFRGTIIKKAVVLGQRVEPTEALLTLADLATVWVRADLHEQDLTVLPSLRDATVQIVADAYPARSFAGRVTYVADVIDPQTRVAHLVVAVPNPERLLKPGMFVRVTLAQAHPVQALRVPESAVQSDAGQTFVFVAGPSGTDFERHNITLGRRTTGWVEVRSGLQAGQRVVSRGSYLLKSQLMLERIQGD